MQIDIIDQTETITEEQLALLEASLAYVAKKEKVIASAELSISIVTNDQIKQLNNQYRKKDVATDVLSFPLENPFHENEDNIPVMIGDIIISVEKVSEQSTRFNHSFERELVFLAIHGFLHILGYTHDTTENEKQMFQKQEVILEEFKLERG